MKTCSGIWIFSFLRLFCKDVLFNRITRKSCLTESQESFVQLNYMKIFVQLNSMNVYFRLIFASGQGRSFVPSFDSIFVGQLGGSMSWRHKCNINRVRTSKDSFRISHCINTISIINSIMTKHQRGKYQKIITCKIQIWRFPWTLEIEEGMITFVTHDLDVSV